MPTDGLSPMQAFDHCSRLDQSVFEKALARASSHSTLPLIKRLPRMPMRTGIVNAANLVGRSVQWSMPIRTRTFWGAQMHIRIPESVSNQLFCCGFFELGLTTYMIRLLNFGDTVLDVGAHYGYFTLLASDLVGLGGQVHAFEPTPSTFGLLLRNADGRSNIVANQAAVWAERQEIAVTDLGFRLSAFNSVFTPRLSERELRRNDGLQVSVEAISLDDYCMEHALRPAFVKLDAESSEYQILQGMKWLLSEPRPLLTLEVGDYDLPDVPSSAELVRTMMSYGYAPFEYTNGCICIHKLREAYGYDNLLFAPMEHPLSDLVRRQ
jgi:FkbM family methyltransferase